MQLKKLKGGIPWASQISTKNGRSVDYQTFPWGLMPTCTLCRSQATALPGTRPQFQYSCDSGSQKRIGVLPEGVLASDESLGAESAIHIELLNAWNVECFIGVWCFMIFSHCFFR